MRASSKQTRRKDEAKTPTKQGKLQIKLTDETPVPRLKRVPEPFGPTEVGELWTVVWVGEVRVRDRPDEGAKKVGGLVHGEIVVKLAQDKLWIHHGTGWSLLRANKTWLMAPYAAESPSNLLDDIVVCAQCNRMFRSLASGQQHACSYTREADRDPVSKAPPTPSGTNRKQFRCVECDKVFPTRNSLNSHSWVHGGRGEEQPDPRARKFKCVDCSKRFANKRALARHRWSVHSGAPVIEAEPGQTRVLRKRRLAPPRRSSESGDEDNDDDDDDDDDENDDDDDENENDDDDDDDDEEDVKKPPEKIRTRSLRKRAQRRRADGRDAKTSMGRSRKRLRSNDSGKDEADSNGKYPCRVCGRLFESPYALSGHKKAHRARGETPRSAASRFNIAPLGLVSAAEKMHSGSRVDRRVSRRRQRVPLVGDRVKVRVEKTSFYRGELVAVEPLPAKAGTRRWRIEISYGDEIEETIFPDPRIVLLN